MTSPGLTVLPDLNEEQIRRLISLLDSGQPRNWHWLTSWVTGGMAGLGKIFFGTTAAGTDPRQSADADDAEGIISAYENPANWLGYTEEDMAAA